MEKLILASGSPRRRQLMSLLPWRFEVISKEVDEKLDLGLSPCENVQALALKKAAAVSVDYPDRIVIGMDTMVCLGDKMLGKPKDEEEAVRMLMALGGREHTVITGVGIICPEKKIKECFYEETKVMMMAMTQSECRAYIATGEPMDKAGSYGIQGIGARYIEKISGDYYNVVGLPVHRVYKYLKQMTE